MIIHWFLILILLIVIESVLVFLSHTKRGERFFDIIPLVFCLFATGMLLANGGIIDRSNSIIQQVIDIMLPVALFLMMVTVDVRSILHLGSTALIVFFAGTFGVMIGMVAGFLVVKGIVGPQFAGGFGALTGSWTGGSANMIAVKEAINVPQDIFTLMVVIDSTVPYIWMALLIFLCPHQHKIDKHHKAKQFHVHDVEEITGRMHWPTVLPMMLLAVLVSLGVGKLSAFFPVIKGVISTYTWVIILVTTVALILGVTPLGHWAKKGVGPWGLWILFLVLLCIGTRGDLSRISTAPWLFLAGFIAVAFHAAILYGVGRLVKAPLFLMVTASQANLGGVASASMLAEIYRPGLASVGLLMAILGNVIGTYAGILVAQICRLLF